MYKLSEKHVEEALSTGLLGMPDVAWSFVQRIQKGTPVFLYDEDRRVRLLFQISRIAERARSL